MRWYHRIFQSIRQIRQKLDPASLGVRLTVGVAAVSALGLGGVAIWMSMSMQYILIATHKQNIRYIADRFPQDVKIYSDMMSLETGIQRAIDNLTTNSILLWVKNSQGQTIAKSSLMQIGSDEQTLFYLTKTLPLPELKQVNGRYWLLCKSSLVVEQVNLGQIYIAQDITSDRIMFLDFVRNLSIASIVSLGSMTGAIAWYVRRSLHPLQQISQLTAKISADRLSETRLNLKNPPTEVKELAQTFEEMLLRLSEAWEHQRQLVSNVSHELRTPLTIVSGYLQSTLRRGNNLTPPQREALEIASEEADRTIQLLQDLLDLARVDSGRMHFEIETVLLNLFLEVVVSMARKYSDRTIEFISSGDSITIRVDPNRLRQVLLNLIDNAIKYSERDPITVTLDRQKTEAVIQVRDRGVGISLQQQTRIFERFYRVDEARSRTTGGTGLGLSIVKTYVEGMGGRISVSSQPNQGSTFTLIFPLL